MSASGKIILENCYMASCSWDDVRAQKKRTSFPLLKKGGYAIDLQRHSNPDTCLEVTVVTVPLWVGAAVRAPPPAPQEAELLPHSFFVPLLPAVKLPWDKLGCRTSPAHSRTAGDSYEINLALNVSSFLISWLINCHTGRPPPRGVWLKQALYGHKEQVLRNVCSSSQFPFMGLSVDPHGSPHRVLGGWVKRCICVAWEQLRSPRSPRGDCSPVSVFSTSQLVNQKTPSTWPCLFRGQGLMLFQGLEEICHLVFKWRPLTP